MLKRFLVALFAGTGVTSNGAFASSSLYGRPESFGGLQTGLLYSRNGGTTWTQLGATTLGGQSAVGVAALGTTILAATFEPRIIEAPVTRGSWVAPVMTRMALAAV